MDYLEVMESKWNKQKMIILEIIKSVINLVESENFALPRLLNFISKTTR